MVNLGFVFGRFQVVHLGHVEYIVEAKKKCEHLIVGISNPDSIRTQYDESCKHRSNKTENPFTYYERMKMIEITMEELQISKLEYSIVPYPINFPELLKCYIPTDAIAFITIYDDWGYKRKQILESVGYRCIVMWKKTPQDKLTSGKEVRYKIAMNERYENLVSEGVFQYISELLKNDI